MLFDQTLMFFHSSSTYNFTAGEYVSLAGLTVSSSGTVINLGNARDLGIGTGQETPQIFLTLGAPITSSSGGLLINVQFQGSTNSTTWTTYAESGAASTASYASASTLLPIAVPRRPTGAALPLYYQINLALTGNGSASISSGTILGGIVLSRSDSTDTLSQYPSGFSVS